MDAAAKPVLVAVDDDPDALAHVAAQLTDRYGRDYRVAAFAAAGDAVRALAELHETCTDVALVLAGRAVASGVLDHVRQLHPHAKRALLIERPARPDDASAPEVQSAIALGRIDAVVVRPAPERDEVFHESVSSFLLDWTREQRLVPHTVRIVGDEWAGRAFELRETFERCAVPHSFCLADSEQGRALLERVGPGVTLPLMVLPDGRVLSDPTDAEIAEAAGAPADVDGDEFDIVIVGAGPAGLSAAVYGASEGLRVLVIDAGGIGGQARASSLIRNYLGFPKGVSGSRLAEQAYQQAAMFGASFLFMHRVTELARYGDGFAVVLSDGRRIGARAVILAMGAAYRRLGIPTLERLTGAGVFYGGAGSEASALSGKDVYVAGGGNAAGQAALHLARYARSVTLVVRAESLEAGMSHYLARGVEAAANVGVATRTEIVGGGGDGRLEQLVLRDNRDGTERTVPADALFVLIGARPQTAWLPEEIATDARGFLLTGDDVAELDEWPLERRPFLLETSMPGVLAAGDVRHGSVKRVAAAVGAGSIAVQLVHGLLASEPLTAAAR